jgi:hypothetical protein
MYLKKLIMTAIGMCFLGYSVLLTATADMTTRRHVVTFLEANANTGLAQEMLPNILDSLVELYKTKTVESADISRYGAYLSRFQNLKSLFYEVAEWAELSESAVLIGEYFVLSIGMDPLQQYGRYLHTLEINQRLAIEAIVWNKNLGTTDRRSRLGNSLRELNLFDSERDLQSFVNTVFVAYIHSHLWVEEKKGRFGSSRFTNRDYFRGYLRISDTLSFLGREKAAFVSAFEELQNQAVIEIMEARDPAVMNGIRHTLTRMPLRNGEIVIVPVLTMLLPIRDMLKAGDDLQFLKTIHPDFKNGILKRNFSNFDAKMKTRGHNNTLDKMFTLRLAYIRFLPPWSIPIVKKPIR